ncbi:MAG: HNH endonuclease [Anaerolineales bacterium]|jgi:5-methylcytosine-specific restriction endonuclease McrA
MMNLPVLVLNANYEPLNVCSTRRAINLYLSGKAEMLLNGRGYIYTVRERFPRPSVIRLGYMVKRPYPRVRLSKREIFRRDHFTCQYCGAQTKHLTLDHVVPRHRGGEYSWFNLVTACQKCNLRKGGRTLEDASMTLRHPPFEPRATASYLYSSYLEKNEAWRPFLDGW